MKNQIIDMLINILTTLLGMIVVALLSLCFPRLIIGLPAFPEFPLSLDQIPLIQLLGFIPVIIGALMMLWSYWQFVFYGKGTPAHFKLPNRLVIRGLYRFVRNPMLIGFNLIWIGEIIFYQSGIILVIAIIQHFLILHGFLVVNVEEPMLESRFGKTYVEYCNNVPRWLPRLTPYRANNK